MYRYRLTYVYIYIYMNICMRVPTFASQCDEWAICVGGHGYASSYYLIASTASLSP